MTPSSKIKLNPLEFAAWEAFVLVVQNFLGNQRAEQDVELGDNMLKYCYGAEGSTVSTTARWSREPARPIARNVKVVAPDNSGTDGSPIGPIFANG